MPTPVKPFVIPDWANPDNASVLDSPLQKAARTIGQFLGINDPQSQIMGLATAPIDVPGPSQTIRAFHGSPHDFERFDLSKIGTGEGAQAYGHGLYFAENPEVAGSYNPARTVADVADVLSPAAKNKLDVELGYSSGDVWKARESLTKQLRILSRPKTSILDAQEQAYRRAATQEAINAIDAGKVQATKTAGKMYEVNIHASPDELLDWDKPLSQQPQKVQEKIGQLMADPKSGLAQQMAHYTFTPEEMKDATGRFIYDLAHDRAGYRNFVSSAKNLQKAGIKGIQYLDQGSRAAGQGTRNFVIFDDKIIEIAKKYGISLPAAASLYKTWQQYGAPDEKGVK